MKTGVAQKSVAVYASFSTPPPRNLVCRPNESVKEAAQKRLPYACSFDGVQISRALWSKKILLSNPTVWEEILLGQSTELEVDVGGAVINNEETPPVLQRL